MSRVYLELGREEYLMAVRQAVEETRRAVHDNYVRILLVRAMLQRARGEDL